MVDGDRCVLVVGATGQLGSRVTRQLLDRGAAVRALVRPGSRHQHLAALGAGLVWGDLRDAASVRAAVQGADVVVATANVVVQREMRMYPCERV